MKTLIDAATPHLVKQAGEASIIVVSSLAGFERRHPAHGSTYPIFKRAQAVYAKDLALLLGPQGVRINTIVPGFIQTPNVILPDGTEELSTFNAVKKIFPEWMATTETEPPLKRPGEIDEVANAVLFLSSKLSSYITGTEIVIDGGLSIAF